MSDSRLKYKPVKESARPSKNSGGFSFEQLIGTYGRINRKGYIARFISIWIVQFMGFVLIVLGDEVTIIFVFPGILLFIAAIPIQFCTLVRRKHDFGWGGWQFLFAFVPLISFIILMMLWFRGGDSAPNKHGIPPVGFKVSA